LEFIEEKGGYGEEISQGGTNVSGGQRQRLAIARAIAKNPRIYIFDDSFSALDYKTDALLRSAIQREIGEATMIVIAQRINTIKNADQIIVLDEGQVVGIGKHRELLASCDVYKQIALSQLSLEELAKDMPCEVSEGGPK
jgi:ATP-binding cassette subfamily B protein